MSNNPALLPYKRGNLLLESLTDAERKRLLTGASEHVLEIRTVLFESNEVAPYVYFPLNGLVSLVTPMIDGDVVEMAVVGREGVVGVPWA
ncbi:MAG: Crp/Fnr family transcriptional regulator, partial [Actinobacteria bacterium]|nr:Crp/Fnr family transcriptional regulator [Actinomycetota bacterium]